MTERSPDRVEVSESTSAAPGAVWHALTDGRAEWWPEMAFDAEPGAPLRETWEENGVVCEATGVVVTVEPPHRLEFRWTQPDWPGGDATVTVTIEPSGNGSVVSIVETDLVRATGDPTQRDAHEAGWRHHLERLARAAERPHGLERLVAAIMARPGPVRLVAVDGPGGAGKSTFAQRLSEAAGGAPVIHTDDFASADNPVDWWPRLLRQVVEPLAHGNPANYQRYDWPSETLAEWHTVEPAPIVVIEGVSSGRSEWSTHLAFVIWIETPRAERLRRAVERDGVEALDDWQEWMAAEDEHYRRDPTRERADVIIDGTAPIM